MTTKPDNKFASARASLQATGNRLDSLLRKPVAASAPPPPTTGRVIGDLLVTTSEEELIELLADIRATVRPMPEKVEFVLSHVEQLLRDGGLRFTHSQTRAVKVPR